MRADGFGRLWPNFRELRTGCRRAGDVTIEIGQPLAAQTPGKAPVELAAINGSVLRRQFVGLELDGLQRCENCHEERLVAFSCKHRGFCPSCGARRMAESAALLVDEVLPHEPIRQWVLSLPFQLRFLLASRPAITGQVLGIVYRVISTHLVKKAGNSTKTARTACGRGGQV